jgi:hypothetical protein
MAMDFGDSPGEEAFRLRLREWLQHNNPGLPASSTDDDYWAGQAAWQPVHPLDRASGTWSSASSSTATTTSSGGSCPAS